MAPYNSLAMERLREAARVNIERVKRMKIPSNASLGVAGLIGMSLLLILHFQSSSINCDVESQVRKANALKSAMEEMSAVQQEDRKELASVKQQLEESKKRTAELEVWRERHESTAVRQHQQMVSLAKQLDGLIKEVVSLDELASATGEGNGGSSSVSRISSLTVDELSSRLGDSRINIKKARLEMLALTSDTEIPTSQKTGGAVSMRILAFRVALEELKVAVRARVDAAKAAAAAEMEGGGLDNKTMEQCLKLEKAVGLIRKGIKPGDMGAYAVKECALVVADLSAKLQDQKRGTLKKALQLLNVLQQLSARGGNVSFPEGAKAELSKAVETCQLCAANVKVEATAVALSPAGAEPESCKALGCKCQAMQEEIDAYNNYTQRGWCPDDWMLVQHLIVERNCHSLPRRRCFSANWKNYSEPLPRPQSLWNESALLNSNIRWRHQNCDSFECLMTAAGAPPDCPGCFNWTEERVKFEGKEKGQMSMKEALLKSNSTLRIGLDLGGGTGSFAALMAEHGVTILTTGVDLDARTLIGGGGEEVSNLRNATRKGVPYMETVALRGLIPLHLPHTARLPFFDGTLDVIHASASVDGMEYGDFEDAFYDWDRVLRPGGLIWFSLFHSQVRLMPRYMEVVELFRYTFVHRTVTPSVRSDGLHVYVNFLVEKPRERDIGVPPPPSFE